MVPDQLKISHGWVRCGKCAEVFNAREALETAAALKAGQPAPAHAGLAPQQVSIVLRQQEPAATTDAEPTSSVDDSEANDIAVPPPTDSCVGTGDHIRQSDDSPPVSDDAVHVSAQTAEPVSGGPLDVAIDALPAWLIKPGLAKENDPVVPVAELAQAAEPAVPLAVAVSDLQQTVAHWVRADVHVIGAEPSEPVDGPSAANPIAADAGLGTRATHTDTDIAAGAVTTDAVEPMDINLPIDSVPLDASVALPLHAVPDVGVSASHMPGLHHESAAEVGFIRQARRQAAWASGPARAALGAFVIFAGALLALQVSVHERDRLAAMAPALKPWLTQLCEPIGCEINPFQHIEAVEIVSTELVRAKDGSYRFEMGLRNNAALPVAMPAVELSLTDRNGEAVVRRVVLPDDWVTAPTELTPISEASLTLKMSLVNPDELRMEGFRAVVFYP